MIFQQKESNAFYLMKQHVVEPPLKVVSMCPTMDLIAVQTISGSVWVARWYNALEKIWTLSSDQEKIETFTWRPDGKLSASFPRYFRIERDSY